MKIPPAPLRRAALLAVLTASSLVSSPSFADGDFDAMVKKLQAAKPEFAKRQQDLLKERYDFADKPVEGLTMPRGKPVQGGVRVKLPKDMTWDKLAEMTPDDIKAKDLWPAGLYPLPHPHHEAGGMIFPKKQIDGVKEQTGRDLTRFDLDYDLPDHMLPEFPAPIYLNTRPDLGDVSQGKLITLGNFHDVFKDIINPKQLEGLRLLVTPFPQAQFNATNDRKALLAHQGVACFDCHSNGHTNAATHTVGDIRPNEHRH
ncbi:MAG TPA: cytochrome B6, partial [Candidatus Saccharimonadia bacterium]|nr:cytochrome B6 [Candidatus Saccharimonadia bacterium]